MINFQGCLPRTHLRMRHHIFQKMLQHQRGEHNFLELDELVFNFSLHIPAPAELITTGKWLDPSLPNTPTHRQLETLTCGTFTDHDEDEDIQSDRSDADDFPRVPVRLSLACSQKYSNEMLSLPLSVEYDIDSILGFPTSLAVASSGVRAILYPCFINNIQSDLHIQMNLPPDVETSRRSVQIREVPHFLFGRLVGLLDINLYILFPRLYFDNRKTNFPTQSQLARFFDHILLPAIYANTSPGSVQHYPASYEDAKLKALAQSSEMRSGYRSSQAPFRVQLLHYDLPTESLHAIWQEVIARTRLPGNKHFQDARLFLNAKNLKVETKRLGPLACFTDFLQRWSQSCNGTYLHPKTTWIDYGKEIVYPFSALASPDTPPHEQPDRPTSERPHVHLWRKCCLENLVQHARERSNVNQGGFRTTYYQFAQTAESADLTMTPNKSNLFFQGGLVYSQFYSSTKEIFDAAKTYPFDNPALEALAVDPHVTKATQVVGGGGRIDLGKVQQAYLNSRDRTLSAIRTNVKKSYGVREEHRVTLELLKSIAVMLESPDVRIKAEASLTPRYSNPFFCLPTTDVFNFLEYNCLRFIIPFEIIARSSARNDVIPWEATKVMVMLLRCLRSAFGGSLLRDQSALWKSEKRDPATGRRRFGMGLGETMDEFGIAWLLLGRVDWRHFTFDPAITDNIMFNENALLKTHKARWKRVRTIQGTYLEVNQLAPLMSKCFRKGAHQAVEIIMDHLDILCIRTYRQEVWHALKDYMDFENHDDEVQCLNGEIPLTHRTILRRKNEDSFAWHFPQPTNSRKFTTHDIVLRTWSVRKGEEPVLWDKPFRQLFQYCDKVISQSCNTSSARRWKRCFPVVFLTYNYTFPQPVKHTFLVRESKRRGSPLCFHTTVHVDVQNRVALQDVRWSDADLWCVGSDDRYMQISPPVLPRRTVSDIFRKVERALMEHRARRGE